MRHAQLEVLLEQARHNEPVDFFEAADALIEVNTRLDSIEHALDAIVVGLMILMEET